MFERRVLGSDGARSPRTFWCSLLCGLCQVIVECMDAAAAELLSCAAIAAEDCEGAAQAALACARYEARAARLGGGAGEAAAVAARRLGAIAVLLEAPLKDIAPMCDT